MLIVCQRPWRKCRHQHLAALGEKCPRQWELMSRLPMLVLHAGMFPSCRHERGGPAVFQRSPGSSAGQATRCGRRPAHFPHSQPPRRCSRVQLVGTLRGCWREPAAPWGPRRAAPPAACGAARCSGPCADGRAGGAAGVYVGSPVCCSLPAGGRAAAAARRARRRAAAGAAPAPAGWRALPEAAAGHPAVALGD